MLRWLSFFRAMVDDLIVKNGNSHIYREDDKMKLKSQINKAVDLMECMVIKIR